jgi:hypothetical protein
LLSMGLIEVVGLLLYLRILTVVVFGNTLGWVVKAFPLMLALILGWVIGFYSGMIAGVLIIP